MKNLCRVLCAALLFIVAAPVFVLGSDDSEGLNETYRKIAGEMEELYDRGELYKVIEWYKKECCVDGGETGPWEISKEKRAFKNVNKEIRARIYKFLVLSYFALHRPEPAEIYVRKFLALRHGEKPDSYSRYITEAAQYNYVVAPRWLAGLRGGINFTLIRPGAQHKVLVPTGENMDDNYRKDYGFGLYHSRGMQLGIIIEYALAKNLSVVLQPAFARLKFHYKNSFERKKKNENTEKLNYSHQQELDYVEIPVLLKYSLIQNDDWHPYFQVGGYVGLRESAAKRVHASSFPEREYEGKAIIGINNLISGTAFGLIVGAGIRYNTCVLRLQIEMNYKHGLTNIVDEKNRFRYTDLMFTYYDVFDDMKTSTLEISVKVMFPLSFKAFKR